MTTAIKAETDFVCSIEFLIDESGSMNSVKSQTISGFNAFLEEQRNLDAGKCLFTFTKFDSTGLRTPYVDLDIGMVPDLTENTFCPNSGTNLYDAIYNRIAAVKERTKDWTITPKVMIVVMTDGEDTCSRISVQQVRWLIENSPYRCVFFGSTDSSIAVGKSLGFHESKYFDISKIEDAMRDISTSTTVYRTGAAA
jgi:hypothetical protein